MSKIKTVVMYKGPKQERNATPHIKLQIIQYLTEELK